MTAFPVGSPLPPDIVARRDALPLKPAPVTLTGDYVELRPLDLERDIAALHAVSNGQPARLGDRTVEAYDPETIVWRYMAAGPFASADDLARTLKAQVDAPNGLCLCVHDRATDQPVGVNAPVV